MHHWIVLKTIFKFALKLTLKSAHMFRCKTPSSGSTLIEPRYSYSCLSLKYIDVVHLAVWPHILLFGPCECGNGQNQSDSDQCHTYAIYTNKDQIIIYMATPPNELCQCILTHFNNCNFSKAQALRSLRMVFYTPKHVEAFNVNFNANLKLFLRLSNCASVGEKKL